MKNTLHYHMMVNKLRKFFGEKKGFIEVPAQSRLSILAACEQPETITQFALNNVVYPLPQTGQMWLEHELLLPILNGRAYFVQPQAIEMNQLLLKDAILEFSPCLNSKPMEIL